MNTFKRIGPAVVTMLATYPALTAALVNVGVAVAANFGFHVTPDQLVSYVAMASVFLGLIVHSNVTPLAKLQSPTSTEPASGLWISIHS